MITVVVVDDRAVNREFLATILKYHQFNVLEAVDGLQAYQVIKEIRPDLVITDIIMPKLNGFDLAKKLKKDESLNTIPIIFYTATYRLSDAALLAMECGVQYILSKPSEPEDILKMVNRALEKNKKLIDKTDSAKLISKIIDSTEHLNIHPKLSKQLSDIDYLKHLLSTISENTEKVLSGSDSIKNSINDLLKSSSIFFTLVEFLQDVLAEESTSTLLKLVCKGIKKLLNVKCCALAILNKDNQFQYYFVYKKQTFFSDIKNQSDDDLKLVNWIINKNEIILIDKSTLISDISLPTYLENYHTFLCSPISNKGNVRGCIICADKMKDQFSAVDLEILKLISKQLALKYEHLILTEQFGKQHEKQRFNLSYK